MTVFHVSVNVLLSPYCQEHPRTAPKLERLPASCTECYDGAPLLACHTDHKRHRMNNERHVTNSQFRRTERNCAEAAREKKRGGGYISDAPVSVLNSGQLGQVCSLMLSGRVAIAAGSRETQKSETETMRGELFLETGPCVRRHTCRRARLGGSGFEQDYFDDLLLRRSYLDAACLRQPL